MIRVQKLVKPNKHSGFALNPGKSTSIRGLTLTNRNSYVVYVDKFTRQAPKKTKKRRK